MRAGLWLARAVPADAASLAALETACHSHPWTPRQIAEEVGYGPPGAVLVLRGAGGEWGGIRAFSVHRVVIDEMHLLDVAVAPGVRRQGLATWLVRFALGHGARAGARRALLEVRQGNAAARRLYESLGFQPAGTRRGYYTQPHEDAAVLALEPLAPGPSLKSPSATC